MDWIPTPNLLKSQRTDLRYFHNRQLRCVTWRALAQCNRGESHINAAERNEPGNESEVQSDRLALNSTEEQGLASPVASPTSRIAISYFESRCGGEQYDQWIRPHTNLSWGESCSGQHAQKPAGAHARAVTLVKSDERFQKNAGTLRQHGPFPFSLECGKLPPQN